MESSEFESVKALCVSISANLASILFLLSNDEVGIERYSIEHFKIESHGL